MAERMQVKAYKAVKVDGIRWVLHLKRALDMRLLKNYYMVGTHLQHTSRARDASVTMQGGASNYCKMLVSYKFLLFLHLLLNIVKAISKLSLHFQDDKILIFQLQDKVHTLSSTPEIFKVRPGENLTSFQQGVGGGNQYKGLDLTRCERDSESFAARGDDITDEATAFLVIDSMIQFLV